MHPNAPLEKAQFETNQALLQEISELRERLQECEETLRAIRNGEVDAVVAAGPDGDQVYTLRGADEAYRTMVEGMAQGALTLTKEGLVLFANEQFAKLTQCPLDRVIGSNFQNFVTPEDADLLSGLLNGLANNAEVRLATGATGLVPAYLSVKTLLLNDVECHCVIVTDLSEQRRNELAAAAEKRARSILEQVQAVVISTDLKGKIARWNEGATRLLGYGSKEALGQPISLIGIPGEEDVLNSWKGVRTDARGFRELELPVRTKSGEERYIRVALSLLKDDSAQPYAVIGLAVDITAQKAQEKKLQESEALYRVVTEAMPQIVYITDASGKTQMVNSRLQEYSGISAEECLNPNWISLIHQEDAPGLMANWTKALASGEDYEHEYRLRNKDGEYRWHLSRAIAVRSQDGPIVNWVGTSTNIHDRKLHEEAIREKEDFLRTVFESSPDCLKVLDTDGRLMEMNSSGRCLMEIDDFGAIRGSNWADMWGADAGHCVEALKRAKTGQVGHFQGACATGKGNVKIWDVQTSAVKDASGRVLRFVVSSRDITVERERDAALRASQESLNQYADHLAKANADLLHFAYAVSHDLQTPLRTVTTFAQILDFQFRPVLEEEGSQLITSIVAASSRMGIMITDLLQFAKVAGSEPANAEVPLEESLENALELLGGLILESGASITHDPLPVVRGDAGQFSQIFQNLIGNSIKYRKHDTLPAIHISCDRQGSDWVITVRDNGVGFDPEYADRIFGVFQRLHGVEFAGTGIGLTICKRIVERHGGLIWAESTKGEGAKFSFSIPIEGPGILRKADVTDIATVNTPSVPHSPAGPSVPDEIFQTLHVAQALVRDMQGRIVLWTNGAERLFGFSQAETLGKQSTVLLRKQFPKPWVEIEGELLRSGTWSGEVHATTKDGSSIWLASQLSLYRDGSGRPQSIVEVHNSITKLKEAEESLRRSQEALENSNALAVARLAEIEILYAYAPVGLVFYDKDLRYVRINEYLASINGVPVADHIGRTFAEVLPDIASVLEPQLRRVMETRQPITEAEFHGSLSGSPAGGSTWLISYYPFLSADGSVAGLHGVVQDITSRKATEKAWLESAERLHIATSAADLGVVSWDIPNGRMHWENQRMFEIFGRSRAQGSLSREEFLASSIHPDDLELVRAKYSQDLSRGTRVNLEPCRIRRADGAIRWIQFHAQADLGVDGSPLSLVGVVADVTDQVEAQRVLVDERRHLRTLLDSVNVYIGVLSPEGILVESNRAPLERAGIRPEEVIGKYLPDTFWWSYSTEVRAQIEAAIRKAQSGESSRFDVKARMQDGQLMTLDWAISPLRDEHGVIKFLVPSAVPIEDRKRVESLLATQKEVLELAAKDAPLGDILRVVARAAQQQSGEDSGASIFLLEPDGRHLRSAAAEGFSEAYTYAVDHFEVGARSRSCGTAVRTGETVIVGDVTKDPLWQPFLSLAKEHNIAAVWSQPLRTAGNKVIGTLALYHRTPREPGPGELEAIKLLGQTTALVIERNQQMEQRRRAEAAVREIAKRSELMLDSIDQLAWTAHADGYIVWYNRRWYEYTGTTAEQMEGWGWQSVHDPEKLPEVMERWNSAIKTGEPFDMEFPLRGADGVFRAFLTRVQTLRDSEGNVVQWFGTNTNIEVLRQARDVLEDSERKFRELAERLSDLVWVADQEGMLIYCNRQWESYTGISSQESVARGTSAPMHSDDENRAWKNWREAMASGEHFEVEARLRRFDGSYRWFLNRAEAVICVNGTIEKWLGTSTDIHELKLTEQALRRSNADLEQFVYAANHDLQEPLRMISIYTQLLQKHYGDKGEEAEHIMKFIVNGAKRMDRLLKGILAYSLAGESSDILAVVDSNAIVQKVLRNLESEITANSATIKPGVLPEVQFPENQLSQLLQNLIGNALKYREKRPLQIEISAVREGDWQKFSIADNGIGIGAEYLEQIFGVFKRLHKDDYPGVGVGLAVCKKIVERQGGRIWAESNIGQGTTIYFTISA